MDHEGQRHFIDSETVIGLIKQAPENEKKEIAGILRTIDFANGDVNHFLHHLATGLVKIHY